jgi:hypothetical protein
LSCFRCCLPQYRLRFAVIYIAEHVSTLLFLLLLGWLILGVRQGKAAAAVKP